MTHNMEFLSQFLLAEPCGGAEVFDVAAEHIFIPFHVADYIPERGKWQATEINRSKNSPKPDGFRTGYVDSANVRHKFHILR